MDTLRELPGADAQNPPAFAFGDATTDPDAFARAAAGIEDLSVDAFNGQVANLTPRARAQSARIVSVDARHAAWVRSASGREPAPEAVDRGARPQRSPARWTPPGSCREAPVTGTIDLDAIDPSGALAGAAHGCRAAASWRGRGSGGRGAGLPAAAPQDAAARHGS